MELRPAYPVRSARTALRPLAVGDVDALLAYRSRPDVCRFVPFEPMDADTVRARLSDVWARTTLEGEGQAWVELSGEIVTYELVAGQTLLVHPGHVGMFQDSVSFQVIRLQGIANRYMGDDGHHLVSLTGPGNIWLQSMPLPVLAQALSEYLDRDDHRGDAVGGGMVGGVLGNVLGRGV